MLIIQDICNFKEKQNNVGIKKSWKQGFYFVDSIENAIEIQYL